MVRFKHISLAEAAGNITPENGTMYIFEDRWRSCRGLIEKRMEAHQGRFRSIFARKCSVIKPDAETARRFLEANHVYGYAKCRYRYALVYDGEIVALSTFSAPRPMIRTVGGKQVTVQSYEWVRASSLPDCRVVGGMGKLLNAFVEDVHPEDIMAYADREWSDGDVYEKLGFVRVAETVPVEFYVDPVTFERFPLNKLGRDRAARNREVPEGAYFIRNLGSVKYIRTLI